MFTFRLSANTSCLTSSYCLPSHSTTTLTTYLSLPHSELQKKKCWNQSNNMKDRHGTQLLYSTWNCPRQPAHFLLTLPKMVKGHTKIKQYFTIVMISGRVSQLKSWGNVFVFGFWMQMVLKIEREWYGENVENGSYWSHLHFLPVSDTQPHLLLLCLPLKEQQPAHSSNMAPNVPFLMAIYNHCCSW